MKILWLGAVVAMTYATGQFQDPVFSDLAEGHWLSDDPQHWYAHHDHDHTHDHNRDHHPDHEVDDGGPKVVPVVRECKGDMKPEAAKCGCAKKYGLAENLCNAGEFCNIKEGTCMPSELVTCYIQRAYHCDGVRRRLASACDSANGCAEAFPFGLAAAESQTYTRDFSASTGPLRRRLGGDAASMDVHPSGYSTRCSPNTEPLPEVSYGGDALDLDMSEDGRFLRFSFYDQGRGDMLEITGRRNCKFPMCKTEVVSTEIDNPDDDNGEDDTETTKQVRAAGSGAWLGMSPSNPTSFLAIKSASLGFMTSAESAAFKQSYASSLARGECRYWDPYYTTLRISPYLDNKDATCAAADGMGDACDYLSSIGADCCYRRDSGTCTYDDQCRYTDGMVVTKEYNWLKRVFGDRAPIYEAASNDDGYFTHDDELSNPHIFEHDRNHGTFDNDNDVGNDRANGFGADPVDPDDADHPRH